MCAGGRVAGCHQDVLAVAFLRAGARYLARQRVPAEKVRMAVLVQEIVAADHAGVVFTADPLTGATDRFVVKYVSGLGEGLVQGTIQPERWVVEKQTGRVLTSLVYS